ncbi:HDOD domain-containing protein [uncultured Neptuniibacter sp.]|uniref:HDOD domain-containing protein n=1 Tax=uncultured Neptuniibacter sp. TaxID=502143 RepID=UPI00260F75A8|nr:HDOD domain-containing protein [uncultured Neptuniibacter sp.]
MLSKFKKIFGKGKQNKAKEQQLNCDEVVSSTDSSASHEGAETVRQARELTLSFISGLLGVRALETDESAVQASQMRALLDAELIGLSEDSIPKLSNDAIVLFKVMMDPEVGFKQLDEAISKDPGLAGKVISMANSPAYLSADIEIASLEHAISMLGTARLKHVVMSALVSDQFDIECNYFRSFGKALWEHSGEVANNARKLAERGGGDPSLAYFCGLIHDIGKLIIFKKLVELFSQQKEEPHPVVFSALLNDYSDALTRRACEVWELPDRWCQPVYEFQISEFDAMNNPDAIALYQANIFAELNALFAAGEITEFELVWRLQSAGSTVEEFREFYPL